MKIRIMNLIMVQKTCRNTNLIQYDRIRLVRRCGKPDINKFEEHIRDNNITVYHILACEDIMLEVHVDSPKRINLLYDDIERYYHMITNMPGEMAENYLCKACNKGWKRVVTHVCGQTCSDFMARPQRPFAVVRIPCDGCNRNFRSRSPFNNKQCNTKKNRL